MPNCQHWSHGSDTVESTTTVYNFHSASNPIIYICERHLSFYKQCAHCERYFFDNSVRFIDGRHYCEECMETHQVNFHECFSCSHLIPENEKYCLSCTKRKINAYGFKPTPIFHSIEHNEIYVPTTHYMGIELEINFDNIEEYKDFVFKYKNNDFVYLKRDGSLGNYGVEIVSHPATLHYHLLNNWENIFKDLKHTNTLNCGLHIHLNKTAFNDKEIEFLDYFVNNFTYVISQIGSRALRDYCKVHPFEYHGWGYKRMRWSAHTDACNLTPDSTVELRFCKSTNNYNSFMKKLKKVFSVIAFVKYVCANNLNDKFMQTKNKQMVEKIFNNFRADLLSRI